MLNQFNLKKAIGDYFSLIRLLDGKTFGESRKAVAFAGHADYTSVKNRSFNFKYKSLKGIIYQDSQGDMQINDFISVLDGFTNTYVSFYGIEHLDSYLQHAS